MTLCVAMLIASEFLPVSLLTPMAQSLHATEGATGQAISVSGIFAVLASLLVTTAAGTLDRKWVLVLMSGVMLVSLILIAAAPNFTVLMIARAFLGIAVGGFWALGASVIMRLVPKEQVSTALAVMFAGQAIATAFAAPLGSYLGGIIGWRGVFWSLVPLVVIDLLWLLIALPSLPAAGRRSLGSLFALLHRAHFRRALAAIVFTWAGAFAMFTYLRPFLEQVLGADVNTLSLLLLILGCTGFLGTWAGGRLSGNHARRINRLLPLGMAAITIGLIAFGHSLAWVAVLLGLWSILNTIMPIAWMAWVSQNVEDEPEAAGSLTIRLRSGCLVDLGHARSGG